MQHICACPQHAFDRTWFDNITTAVKNTVEDAARVTRSDPNNKWAFISMSSKVESPSSWASCAAIEHAWHPSLVERFKLHPIIEAMLAYKPDNVAQLALEWPHISESDSSLLAYTRDDAKGHADIQTTTKIGKYVARHWPHIADHIRRDVCSLYTPDECYFLPANVEAFVEVVNTGPKSCMQDGWNGRAPFPIHPYTVYNPDLGWSMAVRKSGGQIDARALTYTSGSDKTFVRAYSRVESNGYSQGDTALAAWLVSQGFSKACDFSTARIDKVEGRNGYVLPYIDGDSQNICSDSSDTFEICVDDDDGEYACNCTNGTGKALDRNKDDDEEESIGQCEECTDTLYENDDYSSVGHYGDCMVCDHCCNRHYTYVTGQCNRGRVHEYYVRDDSAISVDGENYDSENLPDNIRQLEDGDYFDSDTADYCTIDDEDYLCDDYRVVLCDDGEHRLLDECVHCADDEYRPQDDCWQCEGSQKWYSDDEDSIELDGETYHPQYLSELVASKQVAPLFAELV